MSISLDIMKVKRVEFSSIKERDVTRNSPYCTRTITITTETGEEFNLNLYANDDGLSDTSDKLKFQI